MTPIYATSKSLGEGSRTKVLNALSLFFSHGECDDDDDDHIIAVVEMIVLMAAVVEIIVLMC